MTTWTEKAQGSSNPTPSQALLTGRGYILWVSAAVSGGGAVAPTGVTGFTLIGQISTSNGNLNLSAWRHVGAQTGAITIAFTTAPTNVRWKLLEGTSIDTSGTNGAGMIRAVSGTPNMGTVATPSTTPALTLPNSIVSGNGVLGAIAYNNGTDDGITVGTGYTKIGADINPGGAPANQMSVQWDDTGTTSFGFTTVQGSAKALLAFEVVPGAAPPSNPTVDAGADQTVDAGVTVNLTGTPSGGTGPYSHAWTVVSGAPGGFSLTNPNTATPSFVAPSSAGGYTIVLRDTVTDANSLTGTDTVTITVRPHVVGVTNWIEKAQGSGNPTASQSLIANRGYILFISSALSAAAAAPTAVTGFTLIAEVTSGNGNVNLSAWRRVGTQTGALTFTYATPPSNVRWKLLQGSSIDLTGTNGAGMIRAANTTTGASASTAPSLTLPNAIVAGNGVLGAMSYNNGTTDGITAGTGYTKIGTDVNPGGSPANQLSVEWDESGTTTCGWTTAQASSKALIALEIVPGEAVAAPPTVNAGTDTTVDAGDTINLAGTATGGTPAYGHAWTVVSGAPAGFALTNPNTANPSFMAPGGPTGYTIVLRDTVTDAAAQTGQDDVTITVRPHNLYTRRDGEWVPRYLATRRNSVWIR